MKPRLYIAGPPACPKCGRLVSEHGYVDGVPVCPIQRSNKALGKLFASANSVQVDGGRWVEELTDNERAAVVSALYAAHESWRAKIRAMGAPRTRKDDALAACPFCGGKVPCSYVTGMVQSWWIWCEVCGVRMARKATSIATDDPRRAELIAAWNRRATGREHG